MTTTDLTTAGLLADARRKRAEAAALEVEVLVDAVLWCAAHETTDDLDAATWHETGLPIAGEGAPLVAEFAIAEFGAVLGTSTDAARGYLGQAVELAHRLPRLWARVLAGELAVWRARRIAERTISLSPEAAAHVDTQLAPFAHKTGPIVTDRLVEEAIIRFMPQVAEELAKRSAEHRHLTIAHDTLTGSGTSSIYGTLDTADAIDLETVLSVGATALLAGGCTESLDVRRAMALGELARGTQTLPLNPLDPEPFETGLAGPPQEPLVETPAPPRPTRPWDLTLYLHLNADDPSVVNVENAGGHLITPDTLTRWLNTGDARVTIKPVIDLNKPISTSAYTATDKIREHVILRNPRCVFAHCNRRARRTDLDHINPYDPHGPASQTSTENLAPLCRYHHRLKTFSGWTYTQVEPGTYLWRSPHGYQYLVDRHGTTDVTPTPVDPPGD